MNPILTKLAGLREVLSFDNRWHLLVSKAIFREQLNIYRLGGVVFIEDRTAGDANGARHLLVSDMYRRFVCALDLPPSITLVDLGASNGGFPLLLKSMGFKIGRIIAVEMNPATFKRMRFNVELNFDCDLTLLNAAIGDQIGSVELSVGQGSTGDSIFRKNCDSASVRVVQMVTLDAIVGDHEIDLLKMDIEGAEYLVCRSQTGAAFARCKYVLAEIHASYGDPLEVVRYFVDQGLEPLQSGEGGGKASPGDGVYCFVNPRLVRTPGQTRKETLR